LIRVNNRNLSELAKASEHRLFTSVTLKVETNANERAKRVSDSCLSSRIFFLFGQPPGYWGY